MRKLFLLISIGYLLFLSSAYADSYSLSSVIVQNYHKESSNLNLTSYPQYAYRNTFVFNPKKLQWVAYGSNGKVVKTGFAIGGSSYCRDLGRACKTKPGYYSIKSKGGPGCKSSRYPLGKGGAPMPYCAFFNGHYAIHGSYELPNYNASHGCIRVTPTAARWLHANFFRIGTPVVVLPY